MQKKLNQKNKFNITNKNDIATLNQALNDVANKYPIVFDFLEIYCGYNSPLMSYDANEICYSSGKRDVILTLKTLMRDDIVPDAIVDHFKNTL